MIKVRFWVMRTSLIILLHPVSTGYGQLASKQEALWLQHQQGNDRQQDLAAEIEDWFGQSLDLDALRTAGVIQLTSQPATHVDSNQTPIFVEGPLSFLLDSANVRRHSLTGYECWQTYANRPGDTMRIDEQFNARGQSIRLRAHSTSATNTSAHMAYEGHTEYDEAGQLLHHTQERNGVVYETNFSYDLLHRLVARDYARRDSKLPEERAHFRYEYEGTSSRVRWRIGWRWQGKQLLLPTFRPNTVPDSVCDLLYFVYDAQGRLQRTRHWRAIMQPLRATVIYRFRIDFDKVETYWSRRGKRSVCQFEMVRQSATLDTSTVDSVPERTWFGYELPLTRVAVQSPLIWSGYPNSQYYRDGQLTQQRTPSNRQRKRWAGRLAAGKGVEPAVVEIQRRRRSGWWCFWQASAATCNCFSSYSAAPAQIRWVKIRRGTHRLARPSSKEVARELFTPDYKGTRRPKHGKSQHATLQYEAITWHPGLTGLPDEVQRASCYGATCLGETRKNWLGVYNLVKRAHKRRWPTLVDILTANRLDLPAPTETMYFTYHLQPAQ